MLNYQLQLGNRGGIRKGVRLRNECRTMHGCDRDALTTHRLSQDACCTKERRASFAKEHHNRLRRANNNKKQEMCLCTICIAYVLYNLVTNGVVQCKMFEKFCESTIASLYFMYKSWHNVSTVHVYHCLCIGHLWQRKSSSCFFDGRSVIDPHFPSLLKRDAGR